MTEEKVFFKNRDGIKLCGVLMKPDAAADRCVVFCHGLTGTGKDGEIYGDLAAALARAGLASFRFDFRGHGESGGDFQDVTLSGEKRDLESAVSFLKTLGYANFGIVAASFGAGPACSFLQEFQDAVRAVVFWNPVLEYKWLFDCDTPWAKANFGPDAMAEMQRSGFAKIGEFKLKIGREFIDEMNRLNPLEDAQSLGLPILFIHGDSDAIVPCEYSSRYAKSFKNARLEIISGGGHGFHNNRDGKEAAIGLTQKFISENM